MRIHDGRQQRGIVAIRIEIVPPERLVLRLCAVKKKFLSLPHSAHGMPCRIAQVASIRLALPTKILPTMKGLIQINLQVFDFYHK